MANFIRLLLGGVIALGAILLTLIVGVLVVIGTTFGLIASRFRGGETRAGAGATGAPGARRRSPGHGTGNGEVIDVEVTDVSDRAPASRLHE